MNIPLIETNPLENPNEYHNNVTSSIEEIVPWTTKGLKITRLRILSDPGFPYWDISYCHGTLNGKSVEVSLPFSQIPKKGFNKFIVTQAIRDKVYAKRLGILNPMVHSKLC